MYYEYMMCISMCTYVLCVYYYILHSVYTTYTKSTKIYVSSMSTSCTPNTHNHVGITLMYTLCEVYGVLLRRYYYYYIIYMLLHTHVRSPNTLTVCVEVWSVLTT